MSKTKRKQDNLIVQDGFNEFEEAAPVVYPYSVDDDDHCETPVDAYLDISAILECCAIEMNKSKETMVVYDPYFCEGHVIDRLSSIGFLTVYNKREDFYAKQKANDIPNYDVLITNPPYSGDHIDKLLHFCFASNKPWFLLLPNYVYTKDYFLKKMMAMKLASDFLFFVSPKKRYLYSTPKVLRSLLFLFCFSIRAHVLLIIG